LPRIAVSPVTLRDLTALRGLDPLFRLNQPDAQLAPYSSLRAGIAAVLPGARRRRPVFVAFAGDRLVGFAEFRPVLPDERWVLLALGHSVGVFAADPVWEALLAHGVRAAGLRGVRRLFLRTPVGAAYIPALRRLGWLPYATETVFAAYDLTGTAGAWVPRPQRAADTWAIHQLYNGVTPRSVQDTEAWTSHRWDLRPPTMRRGVSVAGWLMDDGHHLVGYGRVSSRHRTHLIELVNHPDYSALLPDLIGGVVATLPNQARRRVYCAVRAYQPELARRLEEHGFAPIVEQELHVKYTTVSVRSTVPETALFHVEVRDNVPRRVPTFLHRKTGDASLE